MIAMKELKTKTKKCRGRPASFDREELITQVMELFWERGYNNLALNEIAKETGLTRASIYNAFKTKEALFLEAINHYFAGSPDAVLDHIKKGDPVGPAFYQLFDEASSSRAADKKRRGCLAVNCMSELMTSNSELGKTLCGMFDGRRRLMQNLILQAVEQKELPEETDAETAANMIQAFMSGFSVFSKNGIAEEKLQAMCRGFLKNLGFAEPQ